MGAQGDEAVGLHPAAALHHLRHGRFQVVVALGDLGAVLLHQALPDAPGGMRCLRGAWRSSVSHPSITAFNGPSFGTGMRCGRRLGGGTAERRAWRTARR